MADEPILAEDMPGPVPDAGELYVMVMSLPAMVADAVAGGLFGGPCWAERVSVTAASSPIHIKRRFTGVYLRGRESLPGHSAPTQRLSHSPAPKGKPARDSRQTAGMVRRLTGMPRIRAWERMTQP